MFFLAFLGWSLFDIYRGDLYLLFDLSGLGFLFFGLLRVSVVLGRGGKEVVVLFFFLVSVVCVGIENEFF